MSDDNNEKMRLIKQIGALFPASPHPWHKDQLNNIYDAENRLIFKPCAFDDNGVGVLPENTGNANFVVWISSLL